MASFVLVHGAWHGGWCWRRVVQRLRAAGHEVFAPTLTGLGDRVHLATPETDLETHITDVIETVLAEELAGIVLCGHSYGGMVVAGAADRLGATVRSLVYLDAFVPEDGQSMFDIIGPDRAAAMRSQAEAGGDGWKVPPISAEWFGVADPADAAWVDRRCVPQPIETFARPARLTGAWRDVPRLSFIRAAGYANSPFGPFADRARDDARWDVHEVPCGHDVMVDRPVQLAALLAQSAA